MHYESSSRGFLPDRARRAGPARGALGAGSAHRPVLQRQLPPGRELPHPRRRRRPNSVRGRLPLRAADQTRPVRTRRRLRTRARSSRKSPRRMPWPRSRGLGEPGRRRDDRGDGVTDGCRTADRRGPAPGAANGRTRAAARARGSTCSSSASSALAIAHAERVGSSDRRSNSAASERADVVGRNRDACAGRLDHVGERVTRGADDRKPGPEVVEDPRAERERGLDVVEVRADADVGLEQVVLAILVRDPVLVEEHVRAGEPELVGQRTRVCTAMRISPTCGLGCLQPEEVQPDVRAAGAGARRSPATASAGRTSCTRHRPRASPCRRRRFPGTHP